jgi:hypothetical protein
MSIVRAARKSQFYTLPTATIEDDRLSWEARGVLVYLLSKPDHWEVLVRDLVNRTKNALGKRSGRDKVYAILKELRQAGYLVMTRRREGGGFTGVDYEVSEVPDLEAGAAYTASLEKGSASPLPEKPETATPDTAPPDTAKPENLESTESSFKIEETENLPGGSGEAPGHGGGEWVAGMPDNYPTSPESVSYAPWMAYAKAFEKVHRDWPIYNASVASLMVQLVKRVGADATDTARYYVENITARQVVESHHPISTLLKNCESYALKARKDIAKKARAKSAQGAAQQPQPVAQTAEAVKVQAPMKKSAVGREALDSLRRPGAKAP